MGNDQEAPSDSQEMPEDTVKGNTDGKKSSIRTSTRDSKQTRVRRSVKSKEIRKSPMSDDGAAAVLSGLANLGSKKEATVQHDVQSHQVLASIAGNRCPADTNCGR
eukprot:jgi/Picre1/32259/NNA_007605.t1